MSTTSGPKSAKVTLSTQHQSTESIHGLVSSILGKADCPACGRLINLEFQFHGDPGPDFAKVGAVSVVTEGF